MGSLASVTAAAFFALLPRSSNLELLSTYRWRRILLRMAQDILTITDNRTDKTYIVPSRAGRAARPSRLCRLRPGRLSARSVKALRRHPTELSTAKSSPPKSESRKRGSRLLWGRTNCYVAVWTQAASLVSAATYSRRSAEDVMTRISCQSYGNSLPHSRQAT
jgi:hypothetical protein